MRQAGRQTDGQTELGWYKYTYLRGGGLAVAELSLPDEESAHSFLLSNSAGQPQKYSATAGSALQAARTKKTAK